MVDKCRLCLSEDSFLNNLSEVRDGLPISVIAMIILPVKIEIDLLPQKICDECLEIIMSAYNLREASSRNERYLRDNLEDIEPVVKQEKVVKFEEDDVFAESSVFIDQVTSPDLLQVGPDKNYHVDCYNRNSPSLAWKYIGVLCDAAGQIVDSDFLYCSLCVAKGNFKKYKNVASTTCLLSHLLKHHNIGSAPVKDKKETPEDMYECDLCATRCSSKFNITRHMTLKHIQNDNPSNNLKVNCYKSENKSFVWKFFGKLIDDNGDEVAEGFGYHFCRVCVEAKRSIGSKFQISNSTTALISHLKSKHSIRGEYDVTAESRLNMKIAENKPPPTDIVYNKSGFAVHCYKASVNKSISWTYFGSLIGSNGKPVKEEEGNLFCKLCVEKGSLGKKFRKTCATTNFLVHLKTVHGIGAGVDESFTKSKKSNIDGNVTKTCSLCNESFESRKAYFNHMRRAHKTAESLDFICHVCSKAFTKNYILVKHMRLHDGQIYRCSVCPANFSYPEGLKRHEMIHDPAHLSRYQCDQCENSYASFKSLKYHILIVHLNKPKERKYCCTFCDMKFFKHCNLTRHVLIHTGEKPHECNYCDATFTQKGDLNKHLNKNHVGDAIYSCTIEGCSAAFRLQVHLREHYRVHYQKNEKIEEEIDA